ncbi:DNA adenine methyltransferase [Paramecium bursaria Chlorella virus SC1A]|uniref:site-specific DNA-methyltransferase (adenine-specific) n=1 Tax=Paramecium bursaria Chlorella virus SC1A TaxID=51374 RepID=Q96719_9PHYC|nr:DNA adenine methyltransferase [Paramecium bursaria Chlorella virus SC1A]AAC57945.1 DNA adenine methyltransferase [Paramecium bursaria Chlorella virus SC1A]
MLSSYSVETTKALSKEHKAKHGIYFTPKSVRDLVWDYIDTPHTDILEPSAGSGEFFDDCRERFPDATIVGVELDADMAKAKKFINQDFLTWKSDISFDLIIGNPPFVQRTKGHVSDKNIVSGRSNLYVEFIYKCLTQHLAPGGTLAFVIPASIGNSAFYAPTRKLLCSLDITAFKILDKHDFVETSTRISILVVKNSPGIGRFVYMDLFARIRLEVSTSSIETLDVTFKTGYSHVQVKQHFTEKSSTPFFTNRDIGLGSLTLSDKTRYLSDDATKIYSGRALLVKTASRARRGGRFVFGFAVYEGDRWSADNDVIIIRGNDIDVIYDILQKQETLDFINMMTTNGHINMRLLKNIPM